MPTIGWISEFGRINPAGILLCSSKRVLSALDGRLKGGNFGGFQLNICLYYMDWFTRSTTPKRPNAVTRAKKVRNGSVAARQAYAKTHTRNNLNRYNSGARAVNRGRRNAAASAHNIRYIFEKIAKGGLTSELEDAKNKALVKDKEVTEQLSKDTNEMKKMLNDATNKIIDDYIKDFKEEAANFRKETDALKTIEKLKATLYTVLVEKDLRVPSDPQIKAILKWILPIFIMVAPKLQYIIKGFKYRDSDREYYDLLNKYIVVLNQPMSGGTHPQNNLYSKKSGNHRNAVYYSHSNSWNIGYSAMLFSWSTGGFGGSGGSGGFGDCNDPACGLIVVILLFIAMCIVGLFLGGLVFTITADVISLIRNMIYAHLDSLKKIKADNEARKYIQSLKNNQVLNPMYALPAPHKTHSNYDAAKSEIFKTYPDGTSLPEGWTREVQNGETWYQRPDEVTQWDAPPKRGT